MPNRTDLEQEDENSTISEEGKPTAKTQPFSLEKVCRTSNFLKNLREVVSSHPDENAKNLGLSVIHLIEGKQERVLECLTAIAESYPDVPLLWRRIAEVHLSRNDYEKAIENLEKVLKLEKNDLTAMIWLGFCFFQIGENKKGSIVFKSLKESVFSMKAENSNWS